MHARRRDATPKARSGARGAGRARAAAGAAALAAVLALGFGAPSAASDGADGAGGLVVGLAGHVVVQELDVAALNEWLAGAPSLPSRAWAAGYGALSVPPRGWGVTWSGASLKWEGRGPGGLSRLRLAHTQVGVVRRLAQAPPFSLTLAILGGLVSAELEVVGGAPESPVHFTMNRFTRYLVSLEPQVGVLWELSPRAALHVAAGYLVAADFWSGRWAHPWGASLPGVPPVFRGPALRLALAVGGP